jgi:TonB family protein
MTLVSATTSATSRPQTPVWPLVLCSLLLHVPLLWSIRDSLYSDEAIGKPVPITNKTKNNNTMRVRVLAQNIERPQEPAKKKPPEPPKKEEKKPDKPPPEEMLTYISLDKPLIEQRPDQAKYMDRWSAKVEREMYKRGTEGKPSVSQEPQKLPPAPPTPKTKEQSSAQPPQKTLSQKQTQQAEKSPEVEQKKTTKTPPKELPTVPHESEIILPKEARTERGDKQPKPSTDGADGPNELPDPRSLFPANAPGPMADKLGSDGILDPSKQLEEGDRTLLNRKETRYWAFFDRVKRQIEREWTPHVEYRRRDPYGNVYGVKDRYATVEVVLNPDGSIRKLRMAKTSGLDFYDDEAVRALNAAAPFANPPEGLMDENGLVRFTFGFYFEISSGRSRFFRMNN